MRPFLVLSTITSVEETLNISFNTLGECDAMKH